MTGIVSNVQIQASHLKQHPLLYKYDLFVSKAEKTHQQCCNVTYLPMFSKKVVGFYEEASEEYSSSMIQQMGHFRTSIAQNAKHFGHYENSLFKQPHFSKSKINSKIYNFCQGIVNIVEIFALRILNLNFLCLWV